MVAGVRQIFISIGLDTHIKSTCCIWITGQAWQNIFVVKQKKMESILIYAITIYLESNEVMCVTISLLWMLSYIIICIDYWQQKDFSLWYFSNGLFAELNHRIFVIKLFMMVYLSGRGRW